MFNPFYQAQPYTVLQLFQIGMSTVLVTFSRGLWRDQTSYSSARDL